MKINQTIRGFVLITLAILLATGGMTNSKSSAQSQTAAPNLADLAWMSGSWRTAPGGRAQIEEHWMAPSGDTMIGMGRTVAGNRTVEFEFLRLERRPDAIYYLASPKGRCPVTEFKLTKLSGQEVMFENPQHDFPKRVMYRKNSDGSLSASVDGGEGTRSQKFEYLPIQK